MFYVPVMLRILPLYVTFFVGSFVCVCLWSVYFCIGLLDIVTTFHHHPTPPTANSMPLISQLFMTRFKLNFKGRYVGSKTTIATTTWTTTATKTTKATFHLLLILF